VNLRRPIVTNGDFVASLYGSVYSDRAVVWHSAVGIGIHVLDGSLRASREGAVSGMVSGIFSIFAVFI